MNNQSPISKRLKEARIAAGLSQKQLGIAAGIDEFSSSARMNQYETGKHTPDFLTIKLIGKVLGCPVAYFYAEEDDLATLIKRYNSLSSSSKKLILKKLLVD